MRLHRPRDIRCCLYCSLLICYHLVYIIISSKLLYLLRIEMSKRQPNVTAQEVEVLVGQVETTRWAIISGPPKFFVYNFHCKQQNCMKFQLEVY